MNKKTSMVFFIAALISYPLAWFYIKHTVPGLPFFLFVLFFITGVELFACFADKQRSKESIFWMIILFLQGLAFLIYNGPHAEELAPMQYLIIHLTAIYYVLSRTGMLVKKETSGYLLLDLLEGIFILPFRNYFLRLKSIKNGIHSGNKHSAAAIVLSVLLIAFTAIIAWSLLANADAHFASIGSSFTIWFRNLFKGDWWLWFLLSLPVGSYLFGLIGGSMQSEHSSFREISEEKRKTIPALTCHTLMIALTIIYLFFFVISIMEFLNASGTAQILAAPAASEFAVKGFWSLIGVMALNGCVLACVQYFGKDAGLMKRKTRTLALILSLCSLAFLFLDAAKLHVYTSLYGCTPKRIYALWALAWLLPAMVITIARLFRQFNCIKLLLCSCIAFFTALCLFDTEDFVLKKTFKDLEAGSRMPDENILEECRFGTSDHVLAYTQLLSEHQWFNEMAASDFIYLYPGSSIEYEDSNADDFHITLHDSNGGSGALYITCRNGEVVQSSIRQN